MATSGDQAERDARLQKITHQLESDRRVGVAWIFGSLD